MIFSSHLLGVVGHVRQHGGHMEHDLVALVGGVQGMSACRIGWRREIKDFTTDTVGLPKAEDTAMLN